MTASQVVVTLSLLARMYGTDPALIECLSYYESGHDAMAANGDYLGPLQLGSEFWHEFAPRYLADETAPHRAYVRANNTRDDALAGMIVGTWAVAHGYRERWSANRLCSEVGR